MKELIRQYAGAVLAAFVTGMLLLTMAVGARDLQSIGCAGKISGYESVLASPISAKAFDGCWSGT